ncbi:MAG: DNA polymerase IV [Deltaproteobacteria bacterium HGW-Deltaproteobacteria-15]|nr:MAG: DNA polymerase IV [Deltaproteobacteria bacterium HGW-Deltaproteobacteria-15]
MHRHIIHLHIPAFPIAAARVCRPELRGRPVAIAPPHSERALLLSVSLEARREGIFKGMPLGKAVKFCPDLIVLPPDQDLTARASYALAGMVSRYTPLWEPSRPGHVYLDVTGTGRLWGKAKDTALHVRQEVRERLRLPGTAGVAANKLVSHLASRVVSSGGVLDVDYGRESAFIAPMKATVLPGVTRIHKRVLLEELSIILVRQVAALDMGSLTLVFGRQAHVIHQRALGIDPTPVYPPQREPVITEEVILPQDENDEAKLLGTLYSLVEKCSATLRRRSLRPRRAGMMFRYADQKEVVRKIQIPHGSAWEFDLYPALETLFVKTCQRRVRIRFMRVWFKDFLSPDPQLLLFSPPAKSTEKRAEVTRALDRVREKYGDEAIRFARVSAKE